MNHKIPIGVKVISIVNYIFSVLFILWGVLGIFGAILFLTDFGERGAEQFFGEQFVSQFSAQFGIAYLSLSLMFFVLGVLSLIIGILLIIFGINLWKGKNWARISEVILGVLWIVFWFQSYFQDTANNMGVTIMIIPALTVIFYLIFLKEVKLFFKR